MGNAMKNNPRFDNQADDTSEHDTDLLLDCVTFQFRRKQKPKEDASGSLRREDEERERKIKELEKKRLEERARKLREEEDAEKKERAAIELAKKREEARKRKEDEESLPGETFLFCLKRPEKTPEELAAKEERRKEKEEAKKRKKEERERKKLEKAKAKAEKAKQKAEKEAKKCTAQNKKRRKKKPCTPEEKEEALKQKAIALALARARKEEARKLQQELKDAERAKEKAESEERRKRAEEMLAEKERREEEEKKQKDLQKEKLRAEKEEAKKLAPAENSDLDLKWWCRLPPRKKADKDKKKPMPKKPAVQTTRVQEIIPYSPPPLAPAVPNFQTQEAQTEPVICKPEKKDALTMITPSSSFEEKAKDADDLKKARTLLADAQAAQAESQSKAKAATLDAATIVTPSLSLEQNAGKRKESVESAATHSDASTYVTPNLSFDADAKSSLRGSSLKGTEPLMPAKKEIETKEEVPKIEGGPDSKSATAVLGKKDQGTITTLDAATMVTPSLSQLEKDLEKKKSAPVDASTLVTPSLSFNEEKTLQKGATSQQDAQKEKAALERALNLNTQPSSDKDSVALGKLGTNDAATLVTPSLSFMPKSGSKDESEKIGAKQVNASTLVTPSLSFNADGTPQKGALETAPNMKTELPSKDDSNANAKSSLGKKNEAQLATNDAATLLTPSLSLVKKSGRNDESEKISPKQVNASTLVTPSLSFNADKTPQKGAQSHQDARKEIEALEAALNIKTEPPSKADSNANAKSAFGKQNDVQLANNDAASLMTPDLSSVEKSGRKDESEKINAKQVNASTLVTPSLSLNLTETPEQCAKRLQDAREKFEDLKSALNIKKEPSSPKDGASKNDSTALGNQNNGKLAVHHQTPSLSLEQGSGRKDESEKLKTKQANASTLVTPSLSFNEEKMPSKNAPNHQDVKRVFEALEKALNIKGQPNREDDSIALEKQKETPGQQTRLSRDAALGNQKEAPGQQRGLSRDAALENQKEAPGQQTRLSRDAALAKQKEAPGQQTRLSRDAATMASSNLNFEQKNGQKVEMEKTKTTLTDASTSSTFFRPNMAMPPQSGSSSHQDEKKEIEALEKALKIKTETSTSNNITEDKKNLFLGLRTPEASSIIKYNASTQIEEGDMTRAGCSAKAALSSRARKTSFSRERGNQTGQLTEDLQTSSEKIMTASSSRKSSLESPSSSKNQKGPSSSVAETIPRNAANVETGSGGAVSQCTQTDCDCFERHSVSAINIGDIVLRRTGRHFVSRTIATQTDFCTCNYEESSSSSYDVSEDCK